VRRALVSWLIGLVLLVAAFFACVAILNATIYSAHGFVSSYLGALNRHDATTARELPGVRAPSGVATNLLTDGALGTIADIRLEHDEPAGSGGIHNVEYSYKLGARSESSTYSIVQTSSYLGLFSRWAFETSPLATVSVAAPHDPRFRVNATDVVSTVKRTQSQPYVVFTPGLYSFDLKTTYLIATPVSVPVAEPASVTPVRVEAEANKMFVTEVSTELHKYYLACATQTVLLPTACPFGKSFSNRVVSTPVWAMVNDPPVTVVPDHTSGHWLVPSAVGTAHLVVKVQSLYDGSISRFDADVPFTVSYTITIGPNNHLTITSVEGP
jgi:hypothetical protein